MIAEIIKKMLAKIDLTDEERLQLVHWFESMQSAPQQLQTLFSGGASRISAVSQITPNLGIMVSGKFIAPLGTATSNIPTETGFTGSFMSGNGETFSGNVYNIGGVAAGILQWGANQATGKLIAGAGAVSVGSSGIIINNSSPSLVFKDIAGNVDKIYLNVDSGNNLEINNIATSPAGNVLLRAVSLGGSVLQRIMLTNLTLPYIEWKEDASTPNVARLIVTGSAGGTPIRFLLGSTSTPAGVEIWANSDGKETVFNDNSYDIDFRIEGATVANVFRVDAGNDRIEVGQDHYIATRNSPNTTTYFNEANQDMDFNVQGDTDSDLFFVDASTDRIGIGTSTPAEKLDVVGNIKASGTITSGAGTGVTPLDGWVASSATWSYSSADSPTFIISINADVTALIGVGDRIKLTQTTAKYFIVTAVGAWSGSATLVTVYGGTDYTLANAAISSPYYSHAKIPFGFPQDPDKWTVSASNTANANKTPPSANTWYGGAGLTNTGISIDVPIGIWKGFYKGVLESADTTVTDYNIYATLSTANNTESDTNNTFFVALTVPSGTYKIWSVVSPPVTVNVAAKTTYYMNIKTSTSTADSIHVRGDVVPTIIRLVCVYL